MRDEKIEKYWFRRNDRKCPEDGKKSSSSGHFNRISGKPVMIHLENIHVRHVWLVGRYVFCMIF